MFHEDLDRKKTTVDLILKEKFGQAVTCKKGRWQELAEALEDLVLHYGARRDVQDKIVEILHSLHRPDCYPRIFGLTSRIAAKAAQAAEVPHSPSELRELMNLEEHMAKIYRDVWNQNDMATNRMSELLQTLSVNASTAMNDLGRELSKSQPLAAVMSVRPS